MLQQMSSPSRALLAEAASARPLDGRVGGDASSEASSDAAEDTLLPECKIKRNYNCAKCSYYTQNPRAYLVHTRDVHFERLKIYDCPHCVYASRHQQKLMRHIKMVHNAQQGSQPAPKIVYESSLALTTTRQVKSRRSSQIKEPEENIEDMLEEVEDGDGQEDIEEMSEECLENAADSGAGDAASAPGRKDRFYACEKCNYVTHIKSRYTKHVKYHSMPMIKCTICDFRTPYKWNLDRHMKNHGGTGSFHCSMCNFTADIKQSLTVHEMNHHSPQAGQSSGCRRRNRVGASDVSQADDAAFALIAKEEEGSDSQSSHSAADSSLPFADIEVLSCNSGSNDATSMDVPTKMETTFTHDANGDLAAANRDNDSKDDDIQSNKQNRKRPRPIPQLIPLNASTPTQTKAAGETPMKKMREMLTGSKEDISTPIGKSDIPAEVTLTPVINNVTVTVPKELPRKKNESFFDKLKERLLTETGEKGTLICKNCNFESKCLSEHSVHEKNCNASTTKNVINTLMPSLGSTRCQNCRHRCKSSADLFVHMKTCGKSNSIEEIIKSEKEESMEVSDDISIIQPQPHPMENVVFVWNNIGQDNKFETPLDININDDSTLPENSKQYEMENVDENEGMNLSPSQAVGKNVFKCPHCPFWASTASRFHVHIVGHLNKKPFECSLCKYKSNWRWDITKHIKLKSVRDPDHNDAKVLMTDETGRRNYTKYNRFLAIPVMNENGENEFRYLDREAAMDTSMDIDDTLRDNGLPEGNSPPEAPLNLHTQINDIKRPKRTLWKCKKCNHKDASKEALLEHVREHSRQPDISQDELRALSKKPENSKDPGDLAYRCGHCNQLSNWKHVIQRHCRLKHEGVIKVIAIEKPKVDGAQIGATAVIEGHSCAKCPYKTDDKTQFDIHLQQHTPSPDSIFKCYFCPYFVKNENELPDHLILHGVTDPEEWFTKPNSDQGDARFGDHPIAKRHKCTDCPYETNSKNQFLYHVQFHKLPADTPYKCPECNYSVSKRHLLHQHLRVHGIFPKKSESEAEAEASTSQISQEINGQIENDIKKEPIDIDENPHVWVAAKNEFHKMYKCRYCSYVITQHSKIPFHEKIHISSYMSRDNVELTLYKCLECKFSCDNPQRLAEHSRTHGEIYGKIYCLVDSEVPDEEQIIKLRKMIEDDKMTIMEGLAKEDPSLRDDDEGKQLYFCQKCPARYFVEGELRIHDKNHTLTYAHRCKHCEFSVPLEYQLVGHTFVHTDEYKNKTKTLKMVHDAHPDFPEPVFELVHMPTSSDLIWIVSSTYKSKQKPHSISQRFFETRNTPRQYCCKECPAKFFKTSTLSYHMSLHGGDGDHKCKKCNYAVKNVGNLAKHELLHESEGKNSMCEYESGDDMDYKNVPLSGTDLFQRKTEAQKRVLIDKDKLVRPNDHFPPVLQADPQFGYLMHGNPEFIYPTYLKNGRQKEKRYKCHKCPSAFEKREQYKIHLSLHGSKQRYKCELCDYSVKYYANYVQHMRKHQMNDEAQAERRKDSTEPNETPAEEKTEEESTDNIKLAIKTMPKCAPKTDFQQFSINDQQILRILQRRRSINSAMKEEPASPAAILNFRKLHMCLLCPYVNQRQDALLNHYWRHEPGETANTTGNKCPYCDLAIQTHFLKDHLKIHFHYQKNVTPQCYLASDDVKFTITKLSDDNELGEETSIEINDVDCSIETNDKKMFAHISSGEVVYD